MAYRTDGCHRSYTQHHIDELNRLRVENSSKLSRQKNYKFEDLTDRDFDKLHVVERAEDWVGANGHRHIQWLCRCACGNMVVVKGASLRAGYNKSCGCSQYGDGDTKVMWQDYQKLLECGLPEHVSGGKPGRPSGFKGGNNGFQDLSGLDFGFWHVLKQAEHRVYGTHKIVCWRCQCKCGTIKSVPARDLKSGASQSCGCMSKMSWLEYFTKQYLDDHGIEYEYQKSYDDLLGTGGKSLVYDFVVLKQGQPVCVIECQGEQHYRPIRKFGGAEKLLKQQIHDKLKRDYAHDVLSVPLFEVMYTCVSEASVYDALDDFDILNL